MPKSLGDPFYGTSMTSRQGSFSEFDSPYPSGHSSGFQSPE